MLHIKLNNLILMACSIQINNGAFITFKFSTIDKILVCAMHSQEVLVTTIHHQSVNDNPGSCLVPCKSAVCKLHGSGRVILRQLRTQGDNEISSKT